MNTVGGFLVFIQLSEPYYAEGKYVQEAHNRNAFFWPETHVSNMVEYSCAMAFGSDAVHTYSQLQSESYRISYNYICQDFVRGVCNSASTSIGKSGEITTPTEKNIRGLGLLSNFRLLLRPC